MWMIYSGECYCWNSKPRCKQFGQVEDKQEEMEISITLWMTWLYVSVQSRTASRRSKGSLPVSISAKTHGIKVPNKEEASNPKDQPEHPKAFNTLAQPEHTEEALLLGRARASIHGASRRSHCHRGSCLTTECRCSTTIEQTEV